MAKFVRDVKFDDFEKNKVLRFAVERQLRLIGDVADRIPSKLRKNHPEIDWRKLTTIHHMIEHQYGDSLAKRLWLAATEGLSEIMRPLEKLL